MRLLIAALLIGSSGLALATPGVAVPSHPADPFDTSVAKEKLGRLGMPTVALVAELEKSAKALVDASDCRKAIPALDTYAKQANTLANLISSGLQPFYGASYDDRRNADVSSLVRYESLANEYKTKRNRAIVLEGECAAKLGQRDQAATFFIQALNLIDMKDTEWWARARTGLYGYLEVK